MPPGFLGLHHQPFLPVESVDTLVINLPAFALEQDVKAPVTIVDQGIGQVPDPDSQCCLLIGDTAVALTRPG
jgi:hypothetical protein